MILFLVICCLIKGLFLFTIGEKINIIRAETVNKTKKQEGLYISGKNFTAAIEKIYITIEYTKHFSLVLA